MPGKADTLLEERARLLKNFEFHVTTMQSFNAETNQNMVKLRYKAFERTYAELLGIEEELRSLTSNRPSKDTMESMGEEMLKIETFYFEKKIKFAELVKDLEESVLESPRPVNSTMHCRRNFDDHHEDHRQGPQNPKGISKLPRLAIPTFSGKYEDWDEFEDIFTALVIRDQTLTDSLRLQYLKNALAESPARDIKNLPNTDLNFTIAWSILLNKYQDKRAIVNAHLKIFFDIPALKEHDIAGLNEMVTTTKTMLTALQAQSIDTSSWCPIILFSLSKKLTDKQAQLWEESLQNLKGLPTITEFNAFIENRIKVEHRISDRVLLEARADETPKSSKSSSSIAALIVRDQKCSLCEANHRPQECQILLKESIPERLKILKKHELCENFLYKHKVADCRSRFSCRSCQKRHNTLIHVNQPRAEATATATSAEVTTPATQANVAVTATQVLCSKTNLQKNGILATALVPIKTADGQTITVRALLDQGSQSNFLTERLCSILKQKTTRISIPVIGISNNEAITVTKQADITIGSIHNKEFAYKMQVLVLPYITDIKPEHTMHQKTWSHAANLQLADPNHSDHGEIDLLIGAASYGHLLLYGVRKAEPNRPILQETKLGWIISGACHENTHKSGQIIAAVAKCGNSIEESEEDRDLSEQFKRFFEAEQFPIEPPKASAEDLKAEEDFVKSLKRHKNGKFIVGLPFKDSPYEPNFLGDS